MCTFPACTLSSRHVCTGINKKEQRLARGTNREELWGDFFCLLKSSFFCVVLWLSIVIRLLGVFFFLVSFHSFGHLILLTPFCFISIGCVIFIICVIFFRLVVCAPGKTPSSTSLGGGSGAPPPARASWPTRRPCSAQAHGTDPTNGCRTPPTYITPPQQTKHSKNM